MLKGRAFQRKDLEVLNEYGHKLKCSHYMPYPMPEGRALPCVIYCHGNSGCRADAIEAALILLPSNITVFSLDFSGSGLSEGDYVTLGWKEKDDLKAVVNFLRADEHVSCIGLWGRSMGAVTSLLYGAQDPSIAGMVLDSPFANLVDLMMELVDMYKIRLPKFTVKVAIQYMRKAILKKAQFDIMDLDVTKTAATSFIPALFGHAGEDLFIQPHHSDKIFNSYAGDKNIIKFEGDHNSPRPPFYYDSISIFFHNVLNPQDDIAIDSALPLEEYYGFDTVDEQTWHDILDVQGFLENGGPESAATRWQRSRIEVPFDLLDDSSHINEDDPTSEMLSSQCNAFEGGEGNNANGSYTKDNTASSSHALDLAKSPCTNNGTSCHSLNAFAQYPVNIEDEERMIMEAIAASLQNLEVAEDCLKESPESPQNVPAQNNLGTTTEHTHRHG
eukprot:TRINITY_DN3704_c0_g1_i2.p1 TRINITY_DN3704_c0_g1~~TRINITY_DN3704_c0_g1_i2.p1  ORF type:complete len:444 (-),score=99.82 TRINITY_DN3704_c0_g1_i2:373-1704(-)